MQLTRSWAGALPPRPNVRYRTRLGPFRYVNLAGAGAASGAETEGQLAERLMFYSKPKLLIIDEPRVPDSPFDIIAFDYHDARTVARSSDLRDA